MPFQEEAVTFLNVNKRAILGDEMGLGKTWSALGAAAQSGEHPVLIVCQTQLQLQWQRAIGALFQMGRYRTSRVYDPFTLACKRGESLAPILKSRTPYVIPNTPFSIIHYGLLQDWGVQLRERGYPVVVFDEVQELRHTGTRKYSEASLLSSDAEYVFGLSGTPVYGYGAEMWSVTNAIDFNCIGSQDVFTREWCRGYGDKIVENPKALNDLLVREGLLLRRKYTDSNVAIHLPTVDRKIIDLAHDTTMYDGLISAAQRQAGMYNVASFTQKGKIARLIDQQTRMASGMAKASFAADFVPSLVEAGEKPLVYAWHHGVHNILIDKLRGFNPTIITGKQSQAQKDKGLKRFSNGGTDICLLSLRSAAGLDGLQARATCCVFVELDWSPAIHCLDMDTEILTPDGFKCCEEVLVGGMVAGFDLKTGGISWVSVDDKVDREMISSEVMYSSNTKYLDLAVTDSHRMIYRSLRRTKNGNVKSEWKVAKAKELSGVKRRYIPTCGNQDSDGVALSDDELRLIGLFISDGGFDGKHLTIYQAKHQPWNKEIVDILNGSGMRWTLFERAAKGKSICNWYTVSKGERRSASNKMAKLKGWKSIERYLNKDLSPLLEACTADQLENLIYGIWLGDGTKNGLSTKRITNTNKVMLERLQSLCVRRGKSATLATRKTRTVVGNLVYDLYVSDREDAYLQDNPSRKNSFRRDSGVSGSRVWCVSNKMGTLVIRRNGKVSIVGNSQAETRIARIGVSELLETIPSYYCVSSTSFDEVVMDVLGVKKGQFVGLMGDVPEDGVEQKQAEERAENRIKMLVKQLGGK